MEVDKRADTAETFLVVVDRTPECAKALRFAALRAFRTGARTRLMTVVAPSQFIQWGGVQEELEAEAQAEAEDLLNARASEIEELTGVRPETVIRTGRGPESVLEEIMSDRSVRALVLAAAPSGRPGPLIDYFAGERAGSLPCMVMIIPGAMDDEDLDRLT